LAGTARGDGRGHDGACRRAHRRPRESALHFQDWYPKTLAAADTLRDSGSLTGLGQQFTAAMRRTLESWEAALPNR
jgi:HEXXH motif-containing protein